MQNQEDNPIEEGHERERGTSDADIKAENAEKADEIQDNSVAEKVKELNDKYLRLYSEYDNYRKRTIKERNELLKTASEEVLKAILPVMDDLDRALKANEKVDDPEAIKEGLLLISNKLKSVVEKKGLTPFQSIGETFDPDLMEAITHIPASKDEEKGRVVDEIEKGYKLGEKVIRFAKVVVAQ